jgi:hypothetical protein
MATERRLFIPPERLRTFSFLKWRRPIESRRLRKRRGHDSIQSLIICDRLWENLAKVIFFRCQCLCFINLYHVQYSVQRASQYLKYFVSYYILVLENWGKSDF